MSSVYGDDPRHYYSHVTREREREQTLGLRPSGALPEIEWIDDPNRKPVTFPVRRSRPVKVSTNTIHDHITFLGHRRAS